jgi:isoleucyl-tRNA synthetase
MAVVRTVVEMGRQLRAKNDLKNRQPLASLSIVPRTPEDKDLIQKMAGLILEELNIEELKFVEDESDLVSLSAKANFKTLGRKMGKNMKAVAAQIQALTASQVASLQSGETLTLPEGEVSSEDIIIQRAVQEGLVVEANEFFTVAIDTLISPALELAGISRELVNRIQVFRKGQDFDVVDTVNIKLKTNSEKVKFMWQEHSDFVLTEVQGKDLSFVETLDNAEETELNGENISFTVVKS